MKKVAIFYILATGFVVAGLIALVARTESPMLGVVLLSLAAGAIVFGMLYSLSPPSASPDHPGKLSRLRFLPEDIARLIVVILVIVLGRFLVIFAVGLIWLTEKGLGSIAEKKVEKFFDVVFNRLLDAAEGFIELASTFSHQPTTKETVETPPL